LYHGMWSVGVGSVCMGSCGGERGTAKPVSSVAVGFVHRFVVPAVSRVRYQRETCVIIITIK